MIEAFPAKKKRVNQSRAKEENVTTHPKNFNAVTDGGLFCPSILTFIVLIVRNSHWAFSPSGVPSAVQVRSVMEPSGPPVARTPRCEYSRSWNAIEVIVGTRDENDDVFVRSSIAICRPLTVCRHSLRREQVAI